MDTDSNYVNEITKVLPKNMKKEKIDHIKNIINKVLAINKDSIDLCKHDEVIDILKRENTQLRLDNLKIHEENNIIRKRNNDMHEIILILDKTNKELNDTNKELVRITEELEKMDMKDTLSTVGIYAEE